MKIVKLFNFLTNLTLWVLILTTLVPLLGVLFLWKLVVVLVAKLLHSDLHATDANDTYFAIDDTKKIGIVNAAQIWRVKGRLDVDAFREHFRECFLQDDPDFRRRYRNLYCYLVKFGGYVFKKSVSEVDLTKHVLENSFNSDKGLEAFIAQWFLEERFKEGLPLWQIVVVHLPLTCNTEEYETVLLFKCHHCLSDGYGFIHIVDKLTGSNSPYLVKNESESAWQKIKDAFFFPKELSDLVLNVSRTKDIFYPIKNANRRWFISFNTLDVSVLKTIRRQTNTHFITVMMSLMAGAMKRLLAENMNEAEIPQSLWTANSLPWPNHPRNALVNHWTGGVFKIPFGTANPLERLRGAENFFNHFHESKMNKNVKRLIIPATWVIPSFLMRWGLSTDLYYFRYSNAFASLMLSDKPHFLLGNAVKNIYLPLGLKDSVPTSVLFGVSTSHSNQIDLSVVANTELVPDQDAIDRLTKVYFMKELEELQKCLAESNNNDFIVKLES